MKKEIKIKKANPLDFLNIYYFCKNRSEKSKKDFNARVVRRPYWFLPLLILKKMTAYVAIDNKKIVGVVYITHLKGNTLGIGIMDNYQNKGIGKSLMKAILKGQKDVHLTVREDNIPARKLYESFSFKKYNTSLAMKRE